MYLNTPEKPFIIPWEWTVRHDPRVGGNLAGSINPEELYARERMYLLNGGQTCHTDSLITRFAKDFFKDITRDQELGYKEFSDDPYDYQRYHPSADLEWHNIGFRQVDGCWWCKMGNSANRMIVFS